MFPHCWLYLVLFSGQAWRRESCMKKNFFHYLLIISWFLLLIKSFLKNNMQNVWRFQKKAVPLHRFWNGSVRALSSAGSEHLVYTQRVGGSNPSAPTKDTETLLSTKGRLAQLVQSIWFTPRGSGVRIPQRPRNRSLTKKFVRLFLFLTAFIQTFFILLPYNSGKRVNFAVW